MTTVFSPRRPIASFPPAQALHLERLREKTVFTPSLRVWASQEIKI